MSVEKASAPLCPASESMIAQWAEDLYAQAPMPDKPLNRRLVDMATHMARKPADAIAQVFEDAAGVKGAYRCIENDRLTPLALRRAFAEKTVRDVAGRPVVLCIQDTTSLAFPRAPATEGLGLISDSDLQGILVHSVLALCDNGLPIGLLDQQTWVRPEKRQETRAERYRLPIEEKESFKWIAGMQASRKALDELPAPQRPRLVHIFDREGDVHEVLADVVEHGEGCVIRAMQSRRVQTPEGRVGEAFVLLEGAPRLGVIEVEITRRGDRPARSARVEIRSARLTLQPPCLPHCGRQPLAMTLVEAREIGAGDNVAEPVLWRLWTTEPAQTLQQALGVVRYYSQRWLIEEVHLILKSGCRIEDVRFRTAQRIEKALAIYSPVAVLILQLRQWSRLQPQAPCTQVLDETTWRVLYTRIHHRPPSPATAPPTIRQAVLWIGRLGGHLGRKGDAPPGVRVLWRGWRDLSVLVGFARDLGFDSPPR